VVHISSSSRGVTRRGFLTVAVSAIVAGVVAGVGAYYAGTLAAPVKEVTKTLEQTVRETVTRTVTTTLAPGAPVTTTVTTTVPVTTTVTAPPTTTTVTKTETLTTTVTGTAPAIPPLIDQPMDKIIEGARKEGKLLLYNGTPEASLKVLIDYFKTKYPFLEVEHYRATSVKLAEKFMAEASAGIFNADVIGLSEVSLMLMLARKGLLRPWYHPEVEKFWAPAQSPQGYYCTIGLEYYTQIHYNKRLVSDKEAPTSYMDLLDPKWAGKIGWVDPRASPASFLQYYGIRTTLGLDWHRAFAKQKPKLYTSMVPLTAAVVAGEVAIGLSESFLGYQRQVLEGAPVGLNIPKEGVIAGYHVEALPVKVPHPNAAKLWIDFLLREETHRWMEENFGWVSLREGIGLNKKLVVNPPIKSYAELNIWPVNWEYIADEKVRDSLYKEFESIYLGA